MRIKHPLVSPANDLHLQRSSAVKQALQQARTLHRAAKDSALCNAMPAVRRAHGAGNFSSLSLSALFRQRHLLQRKHFLHTLAVEAGFANWEAYVRVLRQQPPTAAPQHGSLFDLGYPNLWFSTPEQARTYAQEFGGTVVTYGKQAMVVPRENGQPFGRGTPCPALSRA